MTPCWPCLLPPAGSGALAELQKQIYDSLPHLNPVVGGQDPRMALKSARKAVAALQGLAAALQEQVRGGVGSGTCCPARALRGKCSVTTAEPWHHTCLSCRRLAGGASSSQPFCWTRTESGRSAAAGMASPASMTGGAMWRCGRHACWVLGWQPVAWVCGAEGDAPPRPVKLLLPSSPPVLAEADAEESCGAAQDPPAGPPCDGGGTAARRRHL